MNRSLNSFLNYILEDMPDENKGVLESIFPYKKEIRSDYIFRKTEEGIKKKQISLILRNIKDEEYPIDILAYSEIIKILINICLYERSNAQLGAAETLGLLWLCFNSARMHLCNQKKILHATTTLALKNNNFITLPSLFGDIEGSLSKTVYNFFKLLSENSNQDTILSKSLPSLNRVFDKAVEKSSKVASLREKAEQRHIKFAKITFKTMMLMPHEAFGHRSYNRKS